MNKNKIISDTTNKLLNNNLKTFSGVDDFRNLLKNPEYAFIKDPKKFPLGLMFLGLGGSYAYDTYKRELQYIKNDDGELVLEEPSDVDIRGFCFNTKANILFLKDFEQEQYNDDATDTVIFYFNKYAKLLYTCNPNILELMGLPDSKIIIDSPEAKLLRENIDIFLTRKAFYTFGRYAEDQLQRIQNAMARDRLPQTEKEKHILKSVKRNMENVMSNCEATLKIDEELKVYIDSSLKDEFDSEIFIDANFKHFPLRDFSSILNSMLQAVKIHGKITGRNKKKSIQKLEKHAMHLVRLMKMGIEVLSGKGIITSREVAGDMDLLLDIRNGKIPLNDVFEIYSELSTELQYAFKNSTCPNEVDSKRATDLIMTINEMTLDRYNKQS